MVAPQHRGETAKRLRRLGPGTRARRILTSLLSISALGFVPSQPARAQAPPAATSQPPATPADQLLVDKLVWSTVAAVDHANRTGNYAVLRALGGPSFQEKNSVAALSRIFERLRSSRIDLSNALLVSPVYEQRPVIQGSGLRARGVFPLRAAIGFDFLFQNISGEWRLFGISVSPLTRTSGQPNR